MKMKSLIMSTLVLTAVIMVSCNTTGSQNQEQIEIALNNGEKWEVNQEMSPNILAGENILNNYTGDDYKSLADQLKTQNKKLINSCTMDGKSHDELHKWLHPHMQLIESLGDADNISGANTLISQLKESYKTYHTYFQ